MIFDDSADENKKVLEKYTNGWDEVKHEIKTINGGKEKDYEKDYMTTKINSDDDLLQYFMQWI